MKLNNLTPIVLSAAALCAGSLSLSAATSEVVGAVSITVPTGSNIVALPFLKSAVQQGTAGAATAGADIELPADATGLDDGFHYVHVLDGTAAGYVLDIVSVSGNVATVANIGVDDAAALGVAVGDAVAVRPHLVSGDITPQGFGTTLTLLDAGSVGVTTSANFAGAWVNPNLIIYPGEGVILNSTGYSFTVYGLVSEYDVIFSAANGSQIVGSIDPVNGSADTLVTFLDGANFGNTLTTLVSTVRTSYSRGFSSWTNDPYTNVDTSGFKSFIVNTPGVDIVNAGNVIAP